VVKAKRVKGLRCDEPVIDNARRVIETRLGEMLSFAPWVDDPSNVEEIHNLRIAAKRLRYSLELFRFALPAGTGELIDEVKAIQEYIGDMHDADVMIERVLEVINTDARNRTNRLIEIASAVDRGTIAQRHQRLKSATASRTTTRDEVAFFTLIAQRAGDRDRAYEKFIAAWRRMEETDFPGRIRSCIGFLPDADTARALTGDEQLVALVPEQVAG
jgi:CHAD domain-containing protein